MNKLISFYSSRLLLQCALNQAALPSETQILFKKQYNLENQ